MKDQFPTDFRFYQVLCIRKRNQHFTESSFQITFVEFKIRIAPKEKKSHQEDCAIQSQMPFPRDDESSRRNAQYKANCPSQG